MTAKPDDSAPSRHLKVLGATRVELDGRERWEVELEVPPDLLYFLGHFDGDPVLPGVVQLDDAVLTQVERAWPDLGRLERARRLKFVRPIRPGGVVRLALERRSDPGQVGFHIESGGETCTSGILIFRFPGDR